MGKVFLPGDSDFALAMREPNLLVPGKKPIGQVALNENHSLFKHLRWSFIFQNSAGFDHATKQNYAQVGLSSGVDQYGSFIHSPSYAGANYQQAPNLDCTNWSGVTCVALCKADFNQYPGLIASVTAGAYYGNFLLSGDGTTGEFLWRAGNSPTYCQTSGVTSLDHAFVAGTWDLATLRVYSATNGGGLITGTNSSQTTGFAGSVYENYIGYYSRSGGRSYIQPIYACFVFDKALTFDEIDRLRVNLYSLYRNADNLPFPIGVPAGGGAGVTGTGDLVGAGSEIVGTGTRTVTGAGALEGQGAVVVGTGERVIYGTGTLIGQGSDVAGIGATGGVHTGTGDLIGAGSEVVGIGERTITGTGALVSQGSAVVGIGERIIIGSGDLVGAGAEVSGSGAVGGITTGTGDLVGAGSEIVGTGLRTVTGSGALVAQGSAVTGTGERTVTGTGDLVGSGSEIVGTGVGGDIKTGAGALVGQGSAVTGIGKRTITGIGDLVAAGSIIVGAGVRTITGSGALVGAGSEVVGGQTAHDFVTGNTNIWLQAERHRAWFLQARGSDRCQ